MNTLRIFLLLVITSVAYSVLTFYKKVNLAENTKYDKVPTVDDITYKYKRFDLHIDLTALQTSDTDSKLTKNGIFWSDFAMNLVPKGLSTEDSFKLVNSLRSKGVRSLRPGTSETCGPKKGGIVVLEDGTLLCAKYTRKRLSTYAEVLSYYLSRLLKMDNVAEVFLAFTDPTSERWKAFNISALSWIDNTSVSLINWQKNCSGTIKMPDIFLDAFSRQKIITSHSINTAKYLKGNVSGIIELIQWGNLAIFDSLIGHYDRLMKPIGCLYFYNLVFRGGYLHNGIISPEGKVWLIDNEPTFFYQSDYRNQPVLNHWCFGPFYDHLLKTMCVFQPPVVEALETLSEQSSPYKSLWNYASRHEPLMDTIPEKFRSETYANIFNFRVKEVVSWIRQCKTLYL